jgi:hypothetical protein
MRIHTDWYKRTFVPEAYRHSIGILDANGNLIMHLGKYGVYGEGNDREGSKNDIRMSMVRFVSGTDRYICFEDWHAQVIVLKVAYHAVETTSIQMK